MSSPAFVTGAALPVKRTDPSRSCRLSPSMSSAPVSRRAALRLAGLTGLAGVAAMAGAVSPVKAARNDIKVDLEEVKKDVADIYYSDEVLDKGPDSKEALRVREKRVPKPNMEVARMEVVGEVTEVRYQRMVEREQEEAARVKALFGKK